MYRPTPEDFDDLHVTAASAEPFPKPDLKAKRHSRPRRHEKIGGGHFVFRRQDDGRIGRGMGKHAFEHATYDLAHEEAARLQKSAGGTFEVFSRSAIVDGVDAEDWDRAPSLEDVTLDMHAEVRRTGGAA